LKNVKSKNDGGSRPNCTTAWSLSRMVCVLLGALLVAIVQAVWEFPNKRPAPGDLSSNFLEGPWGRLELTPFLLEKPSEMLPDAAAPLQPTRWHFAARTRDQTIAFLQSCSLTVTQFTALTASNVLVAGTEECWVIPTPDVVLSLNQPSRERIYAELEKSPQNVAQRHPFSIRAQHGQEHLLGEVVEQARGAAEDHEVAADGTLVRAHEGLDLARLLRRDGLHRGSSLPARRAGARIRPFWPPPDGPRLPSRASEPPP
jgi:hypothetical protein